MKIWIVEDIPLDAAKASRVVSDLAKSLSVEVDLYWNQDLKVTGELTRIEPGAITGVPADVSGRQLGRLLPDIVILDLFWDGSDFRGGSFYSDLRRQEIGAGAPSSFVLVWSVKPGMAEAQSFLEETPRRDRRLLFTNSKTVPLLSSALRECIKSYFEELFP